MSQPRSIGEAADDMYITARRGESFKTKELNKFLVPTLVDTDISDREDIKIKIWRKLGSGFPRLCGAGQRDEPNSTIRNHR